MTKEQATDLVAALDTHGIKAQANYVAGVKTHTVVLLDSADSVWQSTERGWTWGPFLEHAVYALAPERLVAEVIADRRITCTHCRRLVA